MSSFISHFKAWVAAALIVVFAEGALYALYQPNPIDRTNFLQFAFSRAEPAQRLFTFHKIRSFEHANPTIVQSGDSSGFYGIDPRIVMTHLPSDVTYLNMSCCANLGFRGYYNILEFMAQRNPSLRYMVLYITTYTMPRPELWDADGANLWGPPGLEVFGKAIYTEFMGPWTILHLPSLGFRRQVTNFVYYLGPLVFNVGSQIKGVRRSAGEAADQDDSDPPVDILRSATNSPEYSDFLRMYRKTRGWMPESDQRGGVYAVECDIAMPRFFDFKTMSYKTYLQEVLDGFADLASRYKATLVIAFQPVACFPGPKNAEARTIVEQFKRSHPDVEIPFPLIETWPADMFSVPAHVRHEYADRVGDRLGKAMAAIVARRGY